ncbi:hypothetical protein HaLaN_25825 [Haematococcus lacustris]|uniref:Uncharacterized protein n=1 Tax=Haematococcus lacustris TaxID=44745 RepID=A0A699ZZ79_HAELA|nr:hypothetical protein HaLaN_25825 [Haematococcus lacustris]
MSLVAQCLRGSGPVPRIKSRIQLKDRGNKSGELRAAHIATVYASAGPSTPPGKQREERRAEWKTQRRQVRTRPRLVRPRTVCVPALCLGLSMLSVKVRIVLGRREQGALPAKGKDYPGLGYKRVRDMQPKTQPAAAQ